MHPYAINNACLVKKKNKKKWQTKNGKILANLLEKM